MFSLSSIRRTVVLKATFSVLGFAHLSFSSNWLPYLLFM
uniref:Uncharacterized protein n=1 Tax=Rhizophora mucronata TaxID=61149 RepID=A0A2P2PAV9_RHIMU